MVLATYACLTVGGDDQNVKLSMSTRVQNPVTNRIIGGWALALGLWLLELFVSDFIKKKVIWTPFLICLVNI